MIAVNNLTISFSGRYLFDGINFNINPNDRIGLIGRNGTGKSTLLKLIAGMEIAEEGTVSLPNDFSVGYLPQEGIVNSSKTVYDETMSALGHILSVQSEYDELTAELSGRNDYSSTDYLKLIHRLSDLSERLRILGGQSVDAEIEKILIGLGFSRNEFDKLCTEFSGGWQMRIELAKLLLRKPDVLLLDEPTNHLDIDSIQWLENYLKSYSGAVVIVSHDKNFLNSSTNRTIEIAAGKIFDMNLSYNEFVIQREEQRQHQLNAYKNQQQKIKETEKFIDRFRYKATLASRVQSKVKQLEKIERIELEDVDTSAIDLRFPAPPRSGKLIIECVNLTKSYGSNLVLDGIDFAVEREEKVAFVGKNGEGKSTLSRILADLEDYQGNVINGYNVIIGYYAQHQAELLNGDDTVLDIIDRAATGDMRPKIRTLLGAFLFSGDDVYKKVKVLSGGEKSRLALAKMLLQPVNFLILDEPTNHLDMIAKDILKKALLDFKGALVIVSHDREFLDGLTTKTVYFSGRKTYEYQGGIYEFLIKHNIETLNELEAAIQVKTEETDQFVGKDKLAREAMKQKQKEENKLKKKISALEDEIQNIEAEIKELENYFSDMNFAEFDNSQISKQNRYKKLRTMLSDKLNQWENLHIGNS